MLEPVIERGLKTITSSINVNEDVFKGKRILVTGGAGFLGSWICDVLVKLGAKVFCLDNLSTGRMENIKHLSNNKNFSFIRADVNEWNPVKKFDYIIHSASLPSPEEYVNKPVNAMFPNSVGLLRLLENARLSDSVLLFLSTSEVYGNAEVVPTPETYWGKVNPIGFRSCYDESKRFGEALCMAYFRQYSVDIRIARIFNTYGPRIDPNARYARVVPKFIIQALRGDPLTIHGNGLQTRSFCYVTDTVTALLKMLFIEKCRGEVINIGSPQEIKILDLARIIKKLTNSKSSLIFQPPRPDDPRRRCPDLSKAKSILEWKPKIPLREGLRYTIEWFRGLI